MVENENTDSIETTGTTETSETQTSNEAINTQGETGEETQAAAPTWTPNYKYKVKDEEHEFEEWAKPLITDEQKYKSFQELYTRGHGLNLYKERYNTINEEYSGLKNALQYTSSLVQDGTPKSVGKFIEALGLPEQIFLNYAIDKFKYEQMAPEERAQIDAQRRQQATEEQLRSQTMSLQEQVHQEAVARRSLEIEHAIISPEISEFAKMYDTRFGKVGAFRDRMVERGIFYYNSQGIDKSPLEIAKEVKSMYGVGFNQGTDNSNSQTGHAGANVQNQMDKPTLPTIARNSSGGSKSPIRKPPKSIADLKDRYKELSGQAEV